MKGVYKITNTITGKYYIGSSKNIPIRIQRHFYSLRTNSHHSMHLQNSYNKHGKDAFIHEVILECDNFAEEEQKLLDNLDWAMAYNSSKASGGGDTYTNNPNKEAIRLKLIEGLKLSWKNPVLRYGADNFNWRGGISQGVCKLCSKVLKGDSTFCRPCYFAQRDCAGVKNPFFGKSHTKETVEKLRNRIMTNGKSVVADGVGYPSIAAAGRALGVIAGVITYRIKNTNAKFSKYYFIQGEQPDDQK